MMPPLLINILLISKLAFTSGGVYVLFFCCFWLSLFSLSLSLGLIDLRQQKRPLVAGTSTPFAYLSNSPTFMTMKVFLIYNGMYLCLQGGGFWFLVVKCIIILCFPFSFLLVFLFYNLFFISYVYESVLCLLSMLSRSIIGSR